MKKNVNKNKFEMAANLICAGVLAPLTVLDFVQGNTWMGIGSVVLTAWCLASGVSAYFKLKNEKTAVAAGKDVFVDAD